MFIRCVRGMSGGSLPLGSSTTFFSRSDRMAKTTKPVKFLDGWSESLWVSLAVKAVRIGWPAGLEAAAARLSKSKMKEVLTVQVFEDIFPAVSELLAGLDE